MKCIYLSLLLVNSIVTLGFCNLNGPNEIIGKSSRRLDSTNYKFILKLDTRNSFVGNGAPIVIYGLNIGLKLKNKYQLGVGVYFAGRQSKNNIPLGFEGIQIPKKDVPSYFGTRNMEIFYATTYFSYSILRHKYLEIQLPIEIGYGEFSLTFSDLRVNDQLSMTDQSIAQERINSKFNGSKKLSGILVPALLGMQVTVKLHRWLYPSASFGFRQIINETNIKYDFDGFYYQFGAQLHFGELYRDIFK